MDTGSLALLVVAGACGAVLIVWITIVETDRDSPEGIDRRERRVRRGLALGEFVAVLACIAGALALASDFALEVTPGQQAVYGTLTLCGFLLIGTGFRALRSRKGLVDAPQVAPPAPSPEHRSQPLAPARDPRVTRRLEIALALFTMLGCAASLGVMLFLLAWVGTGILVAMGAMLGMGIAVTALETAARRRLNLPELEAQYAPPAPLPPSVPISAWADYSSRFNWASILLGGAIMGSGFMLWLTISDAVTLLVIAFALVLVLAFVALVRVLQMHVRVTPNGILVINFWSGRSVPWERVTGVDTAPLWSQRAVATAFNIMGNDAEHMSALRIGMPGGQRLVASITAGSSHDERPYSALLDTIERHAGPRGIVVDVPGRAAIATARDVVSADTR